MSCTIEKALADAKALVERLRDHDDAAESLIEQTTALNKRVEAMKQYQEEIQELNEVARHRPRSTLVMGIQQENRQIRELQQENKELRTSLEEHQSALELIMSKYREQMFRLLMASKKDDPGIIMKLKEQHSKIDMVHRNNSEGFFLDASRHVLEAPQHGLERRHLEANQNELQAHVDQITEMAAVMRKAIEIDEQQGCKEQERIFQLEICNTERKPYEDGGRDLCKSRNTKDHESLPEPSVGHRMDSQLQEGNNSCLISYSGLQNCEKTNFHCFQPVGNLLMHHLFIKYKLYF
uniref:FGFR1 oncogene partner 2 isoform X1 n=1 Tax=Urocitellus parryii TaxID=9999 RepID=UPI000E55E979|nr:FGFR1 oncogene partner 2 isoform X1 [Urocitellus parryii]XP_026248130.1 FGFR1 oncogene partner 2 isoform X1 [Urocitellus parryii]XP_026248131.1 FGFR1 oncogene partner 2 isoform X1 [Urocitellus parryii]XP_026248132.1 FGFR1 oncogene partner 2 isoform X1 [Urocitellus parryii]XP_026248133.1 FGFR1 oncogene partner 2 isoform X1 [Urocitellus parryii]